MRSRNDANKETGNKRGLCECLKFRRLAAIVTFLCMTLTVNAFAAGGYTGPIDNLKTVLITIAGSAGIILVVYGGIIFAIAFKKMDQNGELQAVYTIIAGGVLIGLSAVLAVLGV